jgi:hypothetical protein
MRQTGGFSHRSGQKARFLLGLLFSFKSKAAAESVPINAEGISGSIFE